MSILVIVAHPDDETLGAGGTIARWVDDGATVSVLVLGEGSTSRAGFGADAVDSQHEDLIRALGILGVDERSVEHLTFPDNRFDSVDQLELVTAVEQAIDSSGATTIVTHHRGDANVDHRSTYDAVIAATRPAVSPVTTVLSCEVRSSTEWGFGISAPFDPNVFFDITHTLERKVGALAEYRSEIREFPHPRSIEAARSLAKYRGSTVGVAAAEAFRVVRSVL